MDFSNVETEVLCAAMRCLDSATQQDSVRIIRRIANTAVEREDQSFPNRRLVRDIARAFFGEDNPQVDAMTEMMAKHPEAKTAITTPLHQEVVQILSMRSTVSTNSEP